MKPCGVPSESRARCITTTVVWALLRWSSMDQRTPSHYSRTLTTLNLFLVDPHGKAEGGILVLRGCLETFGEGGWPGRGVIPDGCRSQSGQFHVDPGHPSAA